MSEALSILAMGIAASSGGGTGATDYNKLSNKPKVNGIELVGDITVQGEKGDTGEQGPKGDTGPAGPQGPAGETIEYTAGEGINISADNVISLSLENAEGVSF